MRAASATAPGTARRPYEVRIRFHAPLTGAHLLLTDPTNPTDSEDTTSDVPVPTPHPTPAAPPPQAAIAPPVVPPAVPAPAAPVVSDSAEIRITAEATRQAEIDRERLEALFREVRRSVGELRQDRTARLAEWQRAAIELAMTIATRLLHERVASGAFAIETKVRDMIAQLGEDSPVAVRLNPDDLKLLKARLGDEPLAPEHGDPRLLPDPALGRGDCRVEGRESMLLSEVSRELQEIRDELLRSLGHAGS